MFGEETPDGKYQLGQLRFWAVPYKRGQIVHEKFLHPINHAERIIKIRAPSDDMNYEDHEAYVRSKHGRFLTLEEAQEFLNGNALYPGED